MTAGLGDDTCVVIVLIGPMGCGKTTIGKLLSRRLGWPFYDGDDFHPEENVTKMRAGVALTDEDRLPWLERLRDEIIGWVRSGRPSILACSALKQSYRDTLGIDQARVVSVLLKGDFDLLRRRVSTRRHRYMPGALLRTQMDALEAPTGGLTVDVSPPPPEIVATIVESLQLRVRAKISSQF